MATVYMPAVWSNNQSRNPVLNIKKCPSVGWENDYISERAANPARRDQMAGRYLSCEFLG